MKLSIFDWLCIYLGTTFFVRFFVGTQLYPSEWMASFLPGGINDVNLLFIHEILQAGLIVGGVLLFLRFRGKTVKEIGWRLPQNPKDLIYAVIFGILTCSFMLMVSSILVQLFPQWATTQNVVSTALQVDTLWGVIAAFLSVGVMAPLCEELLFRGYLYHAVRNKFKVLPSVMITALIFALIHGQWFQLFPLFMAGLFLNGFYVRTQSLIATIVMHGAWNTFSLYLVVYMNIVV